MMYDYDANPGGSYSFIIRRIETAMLQPAAVIFGTQYRKITFHKRQHTYRRYICLPILYFFSSNTIFSTSLQNGNMSTGCIRTAA